MRRRKRALIFDGRFRAAWIISLVLHVSLFAWVSLAPSQPKYRFFGSGTAVNLVGADEIPGGSARGKSGDRPEDMESPARLEGPAEGARKIAAPRKKPEPRKSAPKKKVEQPAPKKVEKKSAAKKEAPPRKKPAKKKIVEKKAPPKKKARRIAVKKKNSPRKKKVVRRKKKRDPALEARRKRMRERRARAARWRRKFRESGASASAPGKRKPRDGRPGGDRLAKATLPPARRAPSRGYPGEGGGDGQGGGSRGGGGGGAARTDLERYYGLLAERIGSYWTLPLNLSDVGGMKAEITIDVSRRGDYRKLRIHRSSGNVIYDQAALRAVERAASPSLPRPPDTIREAWLFLGFRFCGEKGVC